MSTIEDIILQQDRRGISALRLHLPTDYCRQAARLLLEHPGTVFIATGFYIPGPKAPETDGPPGAIAIGRALTALGSTPVYITDRFALPLLASEAERGGQIVQFPIAGPQESASRAQELVAWLRPSLLIAIERPAPTAAGLYLTMRGVDITPLTGRLDTLFSLGLPSVGIGDGGNEIGMGNLAAHIPGAPSLPRAPAVTTVTRLVIASVSNWGAYGLLAALSGLVGLDLLPSQGEEEALLRQMVAAGAVDGITGRREPTVDSFSLDEDLQVLEELRRLAQPA